MHYVVITPYPSYFHVVNGLEIYDIPTERIKDVVVKDNKCILQSDPDVDHTKIQGGVHFFEPGISPVMFNSVDYTTAATLQAAIIAWLALYSPVTLLLTLINQVEELDDDSGFLIGKTVNGDFTVVKGASAITLTLSNMPSWYTLTMFSTQDIEKIVQINSSGAVVMTYMRDEYTMTYTSPTLTVTSATFAAGDTYVLYTNVRNKVKDELDIFTIDKLNSVVGITGSTDVGIAIATDVDHRGRYDLSTEVSKAGVTESFGYIQKTIASLDLTEYTYNKFISFWLRLSSTDILNVKSVDISIGTSASHYNTYSYDGPFETEWTEVKVSLVKPTSVTGNGANLLTITWWRVTIQLNGVATTLTDTRLADLSIQSNEFIGEKNVLTIDSFNRPYSYAVSADTGTTGTSINHRGRFDVSIDITKINGTLTYASIEKTLSNGLDFSEFDQNSLLSFWINTSDVVRIVSLQLYLGTSSGHNNYYTLSPSLLTESTWRNILIDWHTPSGVTGNGADFSNITYVKLQINVTAVTDTITSALFSDLCLVKTPFEVDQDKRLKVTTEEDVLDIYTLDEVINLATYTKVNNATTTTSDITVSYNHRGRYANSLTFSKLDGGVDVALVDAAMYKNTLLKDVHDFAIDGQISLWLYLSTITNVTKVTVKIGSSTSHNWAYDIGVASIAGTTWKRHFFPLNSPSTVTGNGANLSNITYIEFRIVMANQTQTVDVYVADCSVTNTGENSIDLVVKTDDTNFNIAIDEVAMIGAIADETGPDSVDEGDAGALRMTLDRRLHVNINDGTTSVDVLPLSAAVAPTGVIGVAGEIVDFDTVGTDYTAAIGILGSSATGATPIPAGDVVGNPIHVIVGDGTTEITIETAGTKNALDVNITDGDNDMPTMDAEARAGFVKITDGTDVADVIVQDAAFGDASKGFPLFGKYQATPTTYTDNDAAPILLDANGRIVLSSDIEIGAVELKNAADDERALISDANTVRANTNHVLSVQQLAADGTVPPSGSANTNAPFVKLTDGSNDAVIQAASDEVEDEATNALETNAVMYGFDSEAAANNKLRAIQVAVDNAAISATPNVLIDGGIYKNADDTYNDNDAVPFHFNSLGYLKIIGDLMITGTHRSPEDFIATYATTSTLTLTGVPTITNNAQIRGIIVYRTGNTVDIYKAGIAGIAFGYSAGTLTIYKEGVVYATLVTTDAYVVVLNLQDKAYDGATDSNKIIEQNPNWAHRTVDLTFTGTLANGMNYFVIPIDTYKNGSINFKLVDVGSSTITKIYHTNLSTENISTITIANWWDVSIDIMRVSSIATAAGETTTKTWFLDTQIVGEYLLIECNNTHVTSATYTIYIKLTS